MSLERFCRKEVVVCAAEDTIAQVALKMRNEHVGAVVVIDDEDHVLGLITDRDVAVRIVADRLDADELLAEDVMSTDPVVLHRDDSLDKALFTMRDKGVRRVPIVDKEEKIVGMLSLDDVLVLLSGELDQAAEAVINDRGP